MAATSQESQGIQHSGRLRGKTAIVTSAARGIGRDRGRLRPRGRRCDGRRSCRTHQFDARSGARDPRGFGQTQRSWPGPVRRLSAESDINLPSTPAESVENDPKRASQLLRSGNHLIGL
jgi:hypothetical protein